MKNEEVVRAFLIKRPAASNTGNLSSTGNCLYSYNTCIAEYDIYGDIVFNATKYSVTTSRHQSLLRGKVCTDKIVYNIPRNTVHLLKSEDRWKY